MVQLSVGDHLVAKYSISWIAKGPATVGSSIALTIARATMSTFKGGVESICPTSGALASPALTSEGSGEEDEVILLERPSS